MSKFKSMSDDYLRNTYVPDVYQKDIYAIDYLKLKAHGIKCISFDIDDTITGLENAILPNSKPPKAAITLFEKLKAAGFVVILLTNTHDDRGRRFCKILGANGYIARAKKPRTDNFRKILDDYGLEKSQIAHVGDSISNDVAGGNTFGIVTCLVRRVGALQAIGGKFVTTEGQKLRKELKSRGLWRKHHKNDRNDQYYQLGETPKYLQRVYNN